MGSWGAAWQGGGILLCIFLPVRHFSEVKLVGKGVEGGGSYCLTVISNILSLYSEQRRD